jgi:Holliday junction resolvase YEN1
LRTFYYRLLRLIALSIHPVFVFDGPNKPPFKRNKRTGPNVASIPEFLAKQLLKQFGYPIHLAPGEAEAECALLQREGIVDAVLSEDVDTLMFGSGITIRNWSPEKSGTTPTHVNVYDAVETKNGPSQLDREGMILVALMSGGDYVPEGIPGCGPKTACEAAKAGFGRDLCAIPTNDKRAMSEWRERLQHELKTNDSKLFKRKHGALKIPDDFPRLDILGYYTHPAISNQAGLDKLRRAINWDQALDFPGLRDFTHDAFDWVKLEGAKHFIRSLAPSLLVRQLRIRSKELGRLPANNLQAIQEDEALLIKGIHGKRQHPVTDNCIELRVSFTPIELVSIDLSREDPDDDVDVPPPVTQAADVDLDDEVALELEEDAPKKRGPTKFDPEKPARIWVMESIVKVGVPLKVEDWEAGRQTRLKPTRAATSKEPTKATVKTTRAKRTTSENPQPSINSFAKVTKPGSKLSRALAKTLDNVPEPHSLPPHPALQPTMDVIDLLSSSPVRQRSVTPATRPARGKSPSPPVVDLPPSVTKRRRREPMQRSHTIPAHLSTRLERPKTPPLVDAIETLDLLSSPVVPSPLQLPAKKAKTRAKTNQAVGLPRGSSIAASPGKTRQATLDTWRTSATPTKLRDGESAIDTTPIPAPRELLPSHSEAEELDLTLSSPARPVRSKPCSAVPHDTCRTAARSTARPPLTSMSSNSSSMSAHSIPSLPTKSMRSKAPTLGTSSRRTSPRLRKSKSTSPNIDILDLTSPQPATTKAATPDVASVDLSCLSSPKSPAVDTLDLTSSQPIAAKPAPPDIDSLDLSCLSSPVLSSARPSAAPAPTRTVPVSPPPSHQYAAVRRSPRNHTSLSPEPASKTSPPAAWKAREKKKRQIILRKSVAGAWDFADVDSLQKLDGGVPSEVLKGKDRRKWRESEVEFLDLS